jgi:beta-xylosidase
VLSTSCGGSSGSPAASPSGAAETPQETVGEVVLEEDFPDPDVLEVDGTFYAYATQPVDGSVNIRLATSTDLQTWERSDVDPLPQLPDWVTPGRTWAPEVTRAGDGFVMYFTARATEQGVQCIGVARASEPTGPFTPVGDGPLVCPVEDGGAIDAASYEEQGRRYLLWKNDGNCCGEDTWLHLQPLAADGLSLTGPPTRLVKQDQPWEGSLVEAPTLLKRGATYVLLYSANDYGGEEYATGYALAPRLEGPYDKADEPLMSTEQTGVLGPGGQDVVTAEDGTTRILFHGWDTAFVARRMHVAELTWEGDRPVVAAAGSGGS